MHADMKHLKTLPVSERLTLVQELWDSIEDAQEALPLQDWQRELACARLAELQGHKTRLGLSPGKVKSFVEQRRGR